ncbi:MAG TPA: radical SAM protein [Deltaproteobacteria bacterium]|nr:radical SAM protein [Deltaproteobacteria bacterium]
MACFRNIVLLKAPQASDVPHPQDVSDLTELCYLAAVVKDEVESVSIPVDFYKGEAAYREFDEHLRSRPVDLVGISSMTGAFNNAMRLAEAAKRAGKYVVMGGYHPTALYEEVLRSPWVDAVILGEGEGAFRDLVIKGPSSEVAGLAYMEDGRVKVNPGRPVIGDLDALPFPLRSARPRRFGEEGGDYTIDTVYTSRGCPWRCTFCANDTVNKRWRARSPENVVEELALLHDPRRKKLIKIWDANFLTNIKRVDRLCDLMLERGLTNFKLWTETRAEDIVRGEAVMAKLRRVGLSNVSLGIESPNAETLRLMKKKNSDDACRRAVEILTRHGIKSQGYFIIGHYNETVEETERYPEYARALGLRQAVFMVMTPYPGTAVFSEFEREGKIRSRDWDLYNNFCTVVETRGMDRATLKRMYARVWGRFYNRHSFLRKKRFFDMALPPLFRLLGLYAVFAVDRSASREEIKEYLFEAIAAGAEGLERTFEAEAPLLLRLFGELTIRIRHSPGRNIDFFIRQEGVRRSVLARRTGDDGFVRGVTIDLDSVMELGERLGTERLSALSCRAEIVKALAGDRRRRLAYVMSLLRERAVAAPLLHAVAYAAPILLKGVAATAAGAFFAGRAREQRA